MHNKICFLKDVRLENPTDRSPETGYLHIFVNLYYIKHNIIFKTNLTVENK